MNSLPLARRVVSTENPLPLRRGEGRERNAYAACCPSFGWRMNSARLAHSLSGNWSSSRFHPLRSGCESPVLLYSETANQ